MRPTRRLLATASSSSSSAAAGGGGGALRPPPPIALLPPIPLYRRILRGHRRHLPPRMRLIGDEYVKAEFGAHRRVENPAHLVSEWAGRIWPGLPCPAEGKGDTGGGIGIRWSRFVFVWARFGSVRSG